MKADLSMPGSAGARAALFSSQRNNLISAALFVAFFSIFSLVSHGFFSGDMLNVIFLTGAELGTITIGLTLLMISGEIDLSVASVFVFSDYMVMALSGAGVPLLVSALIALSFGAAAGLLNGFLTLRFRIPSFVVTLGMLIFWRSAVAGLTNGESMAYRGPASSPVLTVLGGQIGVLPAQFLWFLGFAAIGIVVLQYTKFGNHVFATGGNREIARALGVNTHRIKMLSFVICALLASFVGITFVARSSYLDPIVATGMEFEAVAASVIGGTLLAGGSGSLFAAAVCAFLLKEIQIGAGAYGVKTEYYQLVVGVLLVLAATFNNVMTRRVFRS
ncbi:MAG TPA: ABC transporter permease [Spirochaetia bacterium]|nr:ABC transporter permease [Spirochaetia bacterium]